MMHPYTLASSVDLRTLAKNSSRLISRGVTVFFMPFDIRRTWSVELFALFVLGFSLSRSTVPLILTNCIITLCGRIFSCKGTKSL